MSQKWLSHEEAKNSEIFFFINEFEKWKFWEKVLVWWKRLFVGQASEMEQILLKTV